MSFTDQELRLGKGSCSRFHPAEAGGESGPQKVYEQIDRWSGTPVYMAPASFVNTLPLYISSRVTYLFILAVFESYADAILSITSPWGWIIIAIFRKWRKPRNRMNQPDPLDFVPYKETYRKKKRHIWFGEVRKQISSQNTFQNCDTEAYLRVS